MSTISCEGVGVLWDVHHPYRFMHEKPETTYQNLRPWLCHTHFKDSTATADGYRYALPGFGDVPLEETWACSRMAATTASIPGMGQALGYHAGGAGHRICAFANYMRTL